MKFNRPNWLVKPSPTLLQRDMTVTCRKEVRVIVSFVTHGAHGAWPSSKFKPEESSKVARFTRLFPLEGSRLERNRTKEPTKSMRLDGIGNGGGV